MQELLLRDDALTRLASYLGEQTQHIAFEVLIADQLQLTQGFFEIDHGALVISDQRKEVAAIVERTNQRAVIAEAFSISEWQNP